MKLKRLEIDGLRGAPIPLVLKLREKSLCLLGENGHGKTTVVDGLELWSSGDVAHYHREGYLLDAVVNIDRSDATVTAEPTALPPLARTIVGGRVSALKPTALIDAGAKLPPPLPILRHRTMADFMSMTPGQKKTELLEFLGLAPLTGFRQTARTASTSADRAAAEAKRQVQGAQSALAALLGGSGLVAAAEELRSRARLAVPILSEADLVDLQLDADPVRREPDRPTLVTDLERALAESVDTVSVAWNAAVADRDLVAADALREFLVSAERVLPRWNEDSCPLCHSPQDRDSLLADVRVRLEALHEVNQRLGALRSELDDYARRLRGLVSALEKVLASPPPSGWPGASKLSRAAEQLRAHEEVVRASANARAACPAAPDLDLPAVAGLLEAAQAAITDDSAPRALADLVRLQEHVRRLTEARADADAAAIVSRATEGLLAIVDTQIRKAIESAIGSISHRAADFYGRLVAMPVYSNLRLEYKTGRAGGVEFSLDFDGRHRVTPPQRIMSESQLNALGLALFLARLKVDEVQPWRTLVLDDVVNSYDSNHRLGLARLLAEEFSDWQILLFTHDRVFAAIARKLLVGWTFSSIVGWTPTGGPVLAEGNVREQLRVKLAEGQAASELGGLARTALEQGLALPLEKLGLEIRYDPLARYSAYELLQALRRGLRDRKSDLATQPVLARMEADSYLVNLGAHDKPAESALTQDDLRRLVDDLAELHEAFLCTACGDPVWTATLDSGRHHQCRCSKLAV